MPEQIKGIRGVNVPLEEGEKYIGFIFFLSQGTKGPINWLIIIALVFPQPIRDLNKVLRVQRIREQWAVFKAGTESRNYTSVPRESSFH